MGFANVRAGTQNGAASRRGGGVEFLRVCARALRLARVLRLARAPTPTSPFPQAIENNRTLTCLDVASNGFGDHDSNGAPSLLPPPVAREAAR